MLPCCPNLVGIFYFQSCPNSFVNLKLQKLPYLKPTERLGVPNTYNYVRTPFVFPNTYSPCSISIAKSMWGAECLEGLIPLLPLKVLIQLSLLVRSTH
jgi:hypothetical protein